MNLIITADIHIKLKPDVSEAWQLDRYNRLWYEYRTLCIQHAAILIIAGDIFNDHKVSSKEMMVFTQLLILMAEAHISVYMIDGNHDYSNPNETVLDHFVPVFDALKTDVSSIQYYRSQRLLLNEQVSLHMLSHSELRKGPPTPVAGVTNILVSHFRGTLNTFITEEIDVSKFTSGFDYTFVGDIHSAIELPGNIVYTNSPVSLNFESAYTGGCLLVCCNTSECTWERIEFDLPKLLKISTTVEAFKDLKLSPKDYYKVTLEGTPTELREILSPGKNCKLEKVPVVPTLATCGLPEEDSEVPSDLLLEDQLVTFMQQNHYSSTEISNMMEAFIHGSKL